MAMKEKSQDEVGAAVDPQHYKTFSVEVIEMMRRIWGSEAFIMHCEMTAFKYRMRAGRKHGQLAEVDLAKAAQYERWATEERQKQPSTL